MRALRPLVLAMSLVLTVVSCAATTAGESGFVLTEFAIDGPGELDPGSTEVIADNRGEFPHTLVITDADGSVVAATDLIQPGESATLDLDLDAGRYQFTCRIVAQTDDGTILDHYEAGMNRMVTVDG